MNKSIEELADYAYQRLGARYYTLGLHRLTPQEVADYFHDKPINGIKKGECDARRRPAGASPYLQGT